MDLPDDYGEQWLFSVRILSNRVGEFGDCDLPAIYKEL